jgi:hypothetical protein
MIPTVAESYEKPLSGDDPCFWICTSVRYGTYCTSVPNTGGKWYLARLFSNNLGHPEIIGK